jgi:hypothetical protein
MNKELKEFMDNVGGVLKNIDELLEREKKLKLKLQNIFHELGYIQNEITNIIGKTFLAKYKIDNEIYEKKIKLPSERETKLYIKDFYGWNDVEIISIEEIEEE